MLQNPSQQFFVGHTASGNTQAGLHNILVAAGQTNPINLQKSKHHIHSDALVAVYKGVVRNQSVA